jgi:hypothetical protein
VAHVNANGAIDDANAIGSDRAVYLPGAGNKSPLGRVDLATDVMAAARGINDRYAGQY